uniref:Uncharacterized protein n=1 Tax=Aureoumbra lagunensis TaxID=44058 RepID=A0A7S3K4L1_9STRA|mmetsp:Transcript_2276/g.3615  ORF Transcript_2276/g.3615 Transcript_2276/m.3615 type:complete len:214 (-) Transcript_2276:163-804(-)
MFHTMFVVVILLLRSGDCQFSDPDQFAKHVEWIDEDKARAKNWPISPSNDVSQPFKDFARARAAKQILNCNCEPFDESMVRKYDEDHPRHGQWRIDLPIRPCSINDQEQLLSLGPYDSKWKAISDTGRLAAQLESCVQRLNKDEDEAVSRIQFEALQIEIQFLTKQINALQTQLSQCKNDNDVLVQLTQTDDLQNHIKDYLKHATADDDSISP